MLLHLFFVKTRDIDLNLLNVVTGYVMCKRLGFSFPLICVYLTGKHELHRSVAATYYQRQIPAATEDNSGSHRRQIPVANAGTLLLPSDKVRLLSETKLRLLSMTNSGDSRQ